MFIVIKQNVFKAIMQEFEKERDGLVIDDYSLKQVISMIIRFKEGASEEENFYEELEDLYIHETRQYFAKFGPLEDYTFEEYLKKVEVILEQERERVEKYLKDSQSQKIISVVEDELLVKNMEQILDKPTGLEYILNNNIVSQMQLLYRLYAPLHNCVCEIARKFKDYIIRKGNAIIDDLEENATDMDQNQMISQILDSSLVRNMHSLPFKDSYFSTAIQSGFASFLNRSIKDQTVSEILGKSTEKYLKKVRFECKLGKGVVYG